MNISDEAVKRYPVHQILMGDGVSFYDMNGSEREAFTEGAEWAWKAFIEGAEWARREALRPIREILAQRRAWIAPWNDQEIIRRLYALTKDPE